MLILRVKKIFVLSILLSAAVSFAGQKTVQYIEENYFKIEIPSGWEKVEQIFGLSQEKKKVYGKDFVLAAESDEIQPRISVHYYAPGNIIHKTADKFIELHSKPALGVALDDETYGPVKEKTIGRYNAKVFECNTFLFMPPRSTKQKKIPMYEKYTVIPTKTGFYVISLHSPAETSEKNIKVYESVVNSFKPLVSDFK